MNEATMGTPEWHVRNIANAERITCTDEEVEILAEDLEDTATQDFDTPTLNEVARSWYRSIGVGNLRSYIDTLKMQDRVKQLQLKSR